MYIILSVEATANKHQQRTEATRRKLLAAALRVFSRDGFERSRLEDIAAEAGHTRGAFYANFATKEDLFIALLEEHASQRVGELAAAIKSTADSKARCRAIREHYISHASDRRWNILSLEYKLYVLRNSKHLAQYAAAHHRIRESFRLEVMDNIEPIAFLSPDSEKYIKVLLEVLLNGLLLEHTCNPKKLSAAEMKHLLGRMFDLLTNRDFDLGLPENLKDRQSPARTQRPRRTEQRNQRAPLE